MFERYTERARRVVFFARYEASQEPALEIRADHLVAGFARENKELFDKIQHLLPAIGSRKPLPNNPDPPMSEDGKLILAQAAVEAEQLKSPIGPEHIALAILRHEAALAQQRLDEGINLLIPQ